MATTLRLDAVGRTHVGHVRRRNEDGLLPGRWLFAVADGLGGHVAGDIASATVIEAMARHDRPVTTDELTDVLGRAIHDAAAALRRKVRSEPALSTMGTTVVALLWSGTTAVLGNVGDSRAYLMRDRSVPGSSLVRLTEDHTYRHLLAGADRVPNLPDRLARFLDGRADGRSADLTRLRLRPGDRILLCSDGLSSYVPEELTEAATNSLDGPGAVADRLIDLALGHGGHDNVTVIVIDVHQTIDGPGVRA
ncbi:protein phosphatase 2C domain-containing protein [Micromonospora sp. NPDC000207]|uniref:PP2C family protein-serine/threonine phosphatase n=1 Tax=Micromonospora sp. NPDC000207 TaxID=3154246 RepID=UPI003324AD75